MLSATLLDDWGMGAIDSMTRSDLLKIIDDRGTNPVPVVEHFQKVAPEYVVKYRKAPIVNYQLSRRRFWPVA